ncbi:MAG: hypothetical protein EOP56_02910 [Sphingobacteriales bacterium]|nr:MAG: hypothetical protein EOP56_02910 [Sphingobacteriales bacterium]
MRRIITTLVIVCTILTGCKEETDDIVNLAPAMKPKPCVDCIVEGYLMSSQTKQAISGKEIALTLNSGTYKPADTSVTTAIDGYFKFQYDAAKASEYLCLYPRPASYTNLITRDLCIMGYLPSKQHLTLGKIYTDASFK